MASASVQVFLLSLTYVLFFSCNGQGSSDIRLAGSINQYEGRVEVYRSGEWQTVCDNSWDIGEAEVVCRQLGYEYAILAIQGAAFGEGSGGQWDREWSCNGNESTLDDCSSSNTSCNHYEDASVICSGSALSNGTLRLVNTGSTQFGGRLEVYYNSSEWGTVSNDSWGLSDATVACRQMGFVGVSDSDSSLFGSGESSQSIWLADVACSGSESRLIDCSHNSNTSDCRHSEDVGIVCSNGYSNLRLVGGKNQYEGRVEVYRSSEWQTVCDNSWGIREAEVVCQQLGYGYAILAIQGAAFGEGSDGQWDREWSCNGNESSLSDCNSSNTSCSHSEDASVICSGSALSNGALRLVNTGSTQFGGRLEVYQNNEWGTVCVDFWGSADATVACRQMGFVGVNDSYSLLFGSGASSQRIWLDNVACSGSESRLIDCSHDSNTADCSHSDDVGIVCSNGSSSNLRLVGGSNQYEGRVEVYLSGEWQTVCDNSWDIKEAEVVCRWLEYGYAILAIQGAAFGQGSGGQLQKVWSCFGNEFSLDECSSSNAFCSHSEDASVICSGSALSNGALRLVDTGSTQFGGRLEIYFSINSEWGTVCDDSWSSSDATVACKQMGFVGVSVSDSSRFGSGASTQNILLDDVACRGSESRLIDCSYDGNTADCFHSEDVGIVCIHASSNIRLVGGSNQYEGRVEVYRSDEWQTVCDNSWDIREAEVVCQQLGYGYAVLAIQGAAFGLGSGGQWDRVWSCDGNEASLSNCSSSSALCSHSEDASVICSGSALSNGALRLVNTGSTQFGGRLEVYFSNSSEWGTVCDDSWSSSDATVACRQMGFVGVSVSDSSRFGSGASTQNILLDDVACRGSESQLIDCNYDGHTADCSHSEDVGIVCTNVRITNDDNNEGDSADGPTVGGGVSGGVIIFIVVCICICCCCGYGKKKKKNRKRRRPAATNVIQMTSVPQPTVVIVNQRTDVQHNNYPTYPQVPGRDLPPAYHPRGAFPGGYPPQQPYP